MVGADPPLAGEELALVEAVGKQVPDLILVLNKSDRTTDEEIHWLPPVIQSGATATSFINSGTMTVASGNANIDRTGFTGNSATGSGTLTQSATNAVIANNGIWDITGDAGTGMTSAGYSAVTVNNTGTILVNDPTGYSPTTLPSILTLNNNGALNIQAGTLNLQGTYVSGGSDSITIGGHGILSSSGFSVPTLTMTGGTLLGTTVGAPTSVTVTGALGFDKSNTLDNIALSANGTTTQGTATAAMLDLQNGTAVTNSGTWTMQPNSGIYQTGTGGSTFFTNNPGATLTVSSGSANIDATTYTNSGTLNGTVNTSPTINNAGAWDITGLTIAGNITNLSTGTISVNDATNYYPPATLDGSLTNSGTVQVQAGTLNLLNNGSNSTYTGNTGSSINVSGGTLNLTPFAVANWSDAGALNVSAGTANLAGAYSNATLGAIHNTGGNVNLTGTLDNTTGTATLDVGATSGIGLTSLSGTITGGTITDSDATPVLNSYGGTLSGVTIGSNLTVAGGSYLYVDNNNGTTPGLTLANGITLNLDSSSLYFNSTTASDNTDHLATQGASIVNLASGYIYGGYGGLPLQIDAGVTVQGYGGISDSYGYGITNAGIINANDPSGNTLYISGSAFTNNGTMIASAGILNIAPTTLTTSATSVLQSTGSTGVLTIAPVTAYWTNLGSINVSAGTVNLGGTFNMAGLGTFTHAAGATVNVTGTLDLAGGSADIGAAGIGLTSLSGGTLLNGTINDSDATPQFYSSYGTLDTVTLGSSLSLSNGYAYILGNLTLATGTTLYLGYGNLSFNTPSGSQSIRTPGTATLTLTGGSLYQYNSGQTLTLGTGLTVNGYGSIYSNYSGNNNLVNNGTIDSSAGYYMNVGSGSAFTNNGTMTASSGSLTINPTSFANAGLLQSTGSTASVTIAPATANWTNAGTINLAAGTLNLGGTFTTANFDPTPGTSFTRSAGTTVNLTGTLDLQSSATPLDIGSAGLFGTGGLTSLVYPGTILNGTITDSDATPVLNSSGGTLNNVTIGSNLTLSTSYGYSYINNNLALANGVIFDIGNSALYFDTAGAQSINTTGTATLTMEGGSLNQDAYGQTLNLGSGLTVNGYGSISSHYTGGVNTLMNSGVIDANAAGQTLTINSDILSNSGTMTASAGSLSIVPYTSFTNAAGGILSVTGSSATMDIAPNAANAWTNAGTINLTAGTLNLGGTFATAGLGTITRAGGSVNLTGTLDNTGTTLDIGSSVFGTGGLTSLTGTILSGTLVSNDGTTLNTSSGTLSGVTIGSNLTVAGGSYLYVNNNAGTTSGLTLANGIILDLVNTSLYFGSTTASDNTDHLATLGSSTVNLAGGTIYGGSGGLPLQIDSGVTVQGWGAISEYYAYGITNAGNIDANVAGQTLNVYGDTFTNSGTMTASAGTLDVSPTAFTNNGSLDAPLGTVIVEPATAFTNNSLLQASGGTLELITNPTFAWSNLGTINVSAGTLNLGGTFTTAGLGTIARTGGSVNLTGILDNTGAILNIGSTGQFGAGGLTSLDGGILNGTVENTDTTQATLVANSGTLNGVTIGSNLSVTGNAYIVNNLVLANGVNFTVSNGNLYFNNATSESISLAAGATAATVTLAGGTINQSASSQTLTLDAGVTVSGYGDIYANYGGDVFVNNGTITANGTLGQTLYVSADAFINNSSMSSPSGTLDLGGSSFTNNGSLDANGGTLSIYPASYISGGTTDGLSANNGGVLMLGTTPVGTTNLSLNNGVLMGGALNVTGTLTLAGTSVVDAGTLTGPAQGLSAGSVLYVNNGAVVNMSGATTEAGTIYVGPGSTFSDTSGFTNTGTLFGTGTIVVGTGTAGLINQGTINPGGTGVAGTLNIGGDLQLATGSILNIEMGGAGAGESDALAVTGNITMGDTLNTSLINGYVPSNADYIPFLMTGGTASGTFATTNLPPGFSAGYNLAAGEAARLIYSSSGTDTFTNAAGGLDWATPGNWSFGILPGTLDTALISSGYAVTHTTGTDAIAALTINSGNSLDISGGSLAVSGNTTLGGLLTVSGGSAALNGGVSGATSGQIGVSAGTLTLGAGTTTTLNSLALTGGTLNGAGALVVNGSFSQAPGTMGNAFSSINITQTAGDLTAGAMGATGPVSLTALNGALILNNVITGASFNGQATAGVDLGTAGTITESGTGNAIILNAGAGNFTDSNSSATALSAASGNWLVYSTDPSLNNIGALTYNFKQYNTAYGGTILGSGNGFIYTLAPTVTFTLTGVTKPYDGTLTAALTAANFSAATGAIDGDTVSAPVSATGTYNNAHVVGATTVSAAGSTSATNGTAAVYGYQYTATGAGSITPAALSSTAAIGGTLTKVYDGTTAATGATLSGSVLGGVTGDVITLNTSGIALNYNTAHVATANTIAATGTAGFTIGSSTAGSVASDYSFGGPTIGSVAGTITPAVLSSTAAIGGTLTKVYDGTTAATGATLSGSVLGGVTGDVITLNTSGIALNYNTAHVATANTIAATGTAGFTIGSSTAGSVASDYSFGGATIASVGGTITPAVLSSTAAIGGSLTKVYDGTAAATGATLSGSVSGGISGDTLSLNFAPVTLAYNGSNVVGTSAIVASGAPTLIISSPTAQSVASDYSFTAPTIANASASITSAALTVTANAATKPYDGLPYSGGNGVTYSGLVNSETSAVLGGTLTYSGTSQGAINQGTYVITPGGLTSSNYNIGYVSGNLNIVPAAPPVVISQIVLTSTLLAIESGPGTSSDEQEKKPKPEEVAADTTATPGSNAATQKLPVCK